MTTKEQQIHSAVEALARLREIDSKFRDHLTTVGTSINDLGSLIVRDSEICAVCLGAELKVVKRPVAIDGIPVAFEYVFGEEHEGILTLYWRMYLDSNGNLYADAGCQKRLWDFNNMYIVKNILLEVGFALLRSARFAPTP